ncbi:MAG: alginate export family protein [Acidobacteria bacterium Pan2503]|uniref:Alginate export family protein n=1 Tax=Candidatus Acidiferrum panamense TaxID=2741543 RepID=A0A7V8NQ76_9BACT|nr:alginate export family protein [Candidatus Acidoferrum panamensis]
MMILVPLLLLANKAEAQCQKPRPILQPLRYEEDWSLLSDRDCKEEPIDNIKYVPLGRENWYLSVGGEIRYRYENYEAPGFGVGPETPSGYILQRYLLHTDWHFGHHFRVFAQFQSGLENGRNGGPRPTDEDVADLHQGFLDITDSSQNWRLRVGRQEIEFGTGHLIGASEGLNIRRAFDGFRFTFKHGRWTCNSTLTHPVLVRPYTFDISDHTQTEWGAGFTRVREHGGWSGYYFGLNRKQAFFNGKTGQDISETFGSRLWKQGTVFDYNTDVIFQTGTFGAGHILAGAVSSNDGLTLHNLRFQPRFAVRFDYASGDSDHNSQNLNTFSPLFPNPQYSSISALLGPSNLTDVGPLIRITLNAKTAISPEMPFYWRSSIHDGIYNFNGMQIRPGNLSTARFVGYQPGVTLERAFSPHLSTTGGYFYFFTGRFLHETPPDKGVGYFYATVTFRF